MSPSYISLAFLLLLIPVVVIGQIMPAANLHIANDRDAALRQLAQNQLEKSLRSSGVQVQDDLQQLKVPGVTIRTVSVTAADEYVVADISYSYSGLIQTKDMNLSARTKSIKLVGARVD